jgi:hypothetical protein
MVHCLMGEISAVLTQDLLYLGADVDLGMLYDITAVHDNMSWANNGENFTHLMSPKRRRTHLRSILERLGIEWSVCGDKWGLRGIPWSKGMNGRFPVWLDEVY